jgi:hypothetical protein
LAAACLRAGLFDNQREPPEMRLQPKLAALQDCFAGTGHDQ